MTKAIVALPIVASALIVGIVITLLWMAGSASGERAKFSSLAIAPKDADVFVAINTDPTSPQWLAINDSLDAINTKDRLRRLIDEALAEVNLDLEEDILPVAGDEAFFSVPDISEMEDGGFVAGFRIRDTGKAREVFDSLRQRAEDEGEELEEEEYEGVTIYYATMPETEAVPDCELNEDGIFVCDGVEMPPDPNVSCVLDPMTKFITTGNWPEPASECEPFWACPDYGVGPEGNDVLDDLDADGEIDSCEEAMRVAEDWQLRINFGEPDEDCIEEQESNGDSVVLCYGPQPLEEPEFSGAVALFGDVLAVGASSDVVRDVIDVVQGRAPSAEENERLQEFREIQKEEFLVWGYADLAQVWDLAEGYADITLDQNPFGSEPADPAPISTVAPTPVPSVPRDDDFAVRSFDSDIIIDSSGSLLVIERIVVDFGDLPKHGIYRDIATRVTYDFLYDAMLTIDQVSVMRDGVPEPFEQPDVGGDLHEIKIGDPNVTITGQHTYEIQYAATGAVIPVELTDPRPGEVENFYEIVWNATGDHWGVPIEAASATITIPDTFLFTPCTVEPDPIPVAAFNRCVSTQEGLHTMRFESGGPVEPGSGLAFYVKAAGQITAPEPTLVPNDLMPLDEEPEEDFPFDFDFDSEGAFEELRGTYDRVGFSVSAASDGFAFDLTVLHAPGFDPKYAVEPTKVFDSHFAGSVPADTMFFLAGYDIYGQTKALGDYLDQIGPSGGPSGEDFLDGFTEATGLDLEEDILSLLTGEYAVAGNASGFENDPPDFSIIAMLDVNDAAKAQESLEAIGDFLEDEGLVDIDASDAVQRWEPLGESGVEAAGVTIARGALIAGYPDKAVEDSVNGFNRSLADTEDWKRTLKLLPQDTTSVGFVSLARIFEELRGTEAEESFNQSTGGELTLEDWAAVRSVAFATTSRDNGFGMHFVLFMEDR